MIPLPENEGIYIIVFQLKRCARLRIGELGEKEFLPGLYFYCGSAKGPGGLKRRIVRHLTKNTPRFWHIDYFKYVAKPRQVWFIEQTIWTECDLVQALRDKAGLSIALAGFGASDCKARCGAHLLFAPSARHLDRIATGLQTCFPELKRETIKSDR